jgi:hypothetical protein
VPKADGALFALICVPKAFRASRELLSLLVQRSAFQQPNGWSSNQRKHTLTARPAIKPPGPQAGQDFRKTHPVSTETAHIPVRRPSGLPALLAAPHGHRRAKPRARPRSFLTPAHIHKKEPFPRLRGKVPKADGGSSSRRPAQAFLASHRTIAKAAIPSEVVGATVPTKAAPDRTSTARPTYCAAASIAALFLSAASCTTPSTALAWSMVRRSVALRVCRRPDRPTTEPAGRYGISLFS